MAQTGHVFANRQFVCAQGWASARAIRSSRPRPLVISKAAGTQTAKRTTKKEALKDARDDVRELIKSKHCNPILVRVAWHDSGTYDKVSIRAITYRRPLASCCSAVAVVLLGIRRFTGNATTRCHCSTVVPLLTESWGVLLQDIAEFPLRGGANGSIRFYPEITHEANAGIVTCMQRAKVWLK